MTKRYFQIKENDVYVLVYLNKHINMGFAISSIYTFYLDRKAQNIPDINTFSVLEVAHFTLSEFCRLFSIEFFFDSNIRIDYIKIDHKNVCFKAMSKILSHAMAISPFFILKRFEEGVKYYSGKS